MVAAEKLKESLLKLVVQERIHNERLSHGCFECFHIGPYIKPEHR